MKNVESAIKILFVLSVLFWGSCSLSDKEQSVDSTKQSGVISTSTELPQSDTVKLGAKLQNPYSIDTMRQAVKRLIDSGVLDKKFENISPTHYYIRFLPRNSADMDAIHFNSDLILMPYPITREKLTSGGIYYRDPDLSDGQPNSQYSVVSVEQVLPNVPYEILAELFLEDDENSNAPNTRSVSNGVSSFDYSLIEQEAFAISGLEYDNSSSKLRGSKWTAKGQIKVKDRSLGRDVGVPGVEIVTHNGFRWRRGYTDSEGRFATGEFSGKDAGFYLKWESANERFDIRNGAVGQAFTDGPNKVKEWFKTFDGGEDGFRSMIFRAGWYYLNNNFGFGNKPFNRISVKARYNSKAPENVAGRYWGISENMEIWGKDDKGNRFSDYRIFSTSAHEFAHAHHNEIYTGGSFHNKCEKRLKESWAEGMQHFISSLVYSEKDVGWEIEHDNKQYPDYWQNKSFSGDYSNDRYYTPLIIDLVDDFDQDSIIDRVSGYTLKQIANILAKSNCKDFVDLKSELKKLKNPKAPDRYLDILFAEMEEGGYAYSNETRMLELWESDAWAKSGSGFSIKFNNNPPYINLKSSTVTLMTIRGKYPIKYPKDQKWKTVGIRVKLSMPQNTPWIPSNSIYAGNLQLSVANSYSGSFAWAGQFDINKTNGYVQDNKYFVQYEFVLSDDVSRMFTQGEPYIRLMFSAEKGAEFSIYSVEFFNANEDDNRVLNLTNEQKSNAVLYSYFISNDSFHTLYWLRNNGIVYKDTNGSRYYYKVGQNVTDEIALTELWAFKPAYEPGLANGFWRQCWIYLGKE